MSSSRASPASPGPIQVESLSRIAQIAESPPAAFQPPSVRAATLDKYPRPSLVLYVVRVPGSRDLFLTTLHPPKSTVTAEDVLGCLYYVHVHDSGASVDGGGGGNGGLSVPVDGGNGGLSDRDRIWNAGSGARPTSSGRKWSAHRILHGISSATSAGTGRADDFRMTLVRRDPATTEQWNVAEIVSIPSPSSSGSLDGSSASGYSPSPISIELLTPGYRRFSSPVVRTSAHPLPPLPPLPRPPVPPPGRAVPPEQEEEYFRRKAEYNELVALHAEQAALADNPHHQPERPPLFRTVAYESNNSRASWLKAKVKRKVFNRSSSSGHQASSSSSSTAVANPGMPAPDVDQGEDRWRGYVFDGIWDAAKCKAGEKPGRVRFKEMAGGRIMKCKYYPHEQDMQRQQLEPSYLVSALEFKLPSPPNPLHGHRRSFSTSSSSRRDEEAGDLGFADPGGVDDTGKSKMGTFVIHEAGMQMLDLVVAANVGVFWRKWEGWKLEKGALGGI